MLSDRAILMAAVSYGEGILGLVSIGYILVKKYLRRNRTISQEEVPVEEFTAPSMLNSLPGKGTVYLKSFGCSHNVSDSEFMMGLLVEYGYKLVSTLDEADVCIVNSCTVKNPSQESAKQIANKSKISGIPAIITGCVPQAEDKNVTSDLWEYSLLGVDQIDQIVFVVEEALKGNKVHLLDKRVNNVSLDLPKIRKNPLIEIIPISRGCLGNCTYCKTKFARGDLGSYSIEAILGRIKQVLSEEGSRVKQIWYTSEDSGAYGLDIGTNIVELLSKTVKLLETEYPDIMLRLGMTNPPYVLQHVNDIGDILNKPNVFSFIHIPVQSGSDSVLKSMKREYTREEFSTLVTKLKQISPRCTVATDIICGFPGETDSDHKDTVELIKGYKFPVLNISQFYARPGTVAAKMKKLDQRIVKQRSTDITNLFDSYETNSSRLGDSVDVWFDEIDYKRKQTVGHTKEYVKVVIDGCKAEILGEKRIVRVKDTHKWHLHADLM
jgi:threonylcarbamoyladenosine tRNA methylthiotransferase CDKAL1